MILVGQYDSPFVRRVAISLRVLGIPYEQDARSVFGDFDWMRTVNPLGRIPSLVLDDGEVLVDSSAILDWLDQEVGPARALMPPSGEARRRAMQLTALAAGAVEKLGAAVYEEVIRPASARWPEWIARCRTQGLGGLARLEQEHWPEALDQPQIMTACLVGYVKLTTPQLMPPGRYPRLEALAARCEARPEFAATRVSDYAVPHGG
jgi:glutathione S-transferase